MTQTFTLTSQHRDEFDRRGLLRLDGLVSAERVGRARDVVLRQLAKTGLWQDGAWRLDAVPRPRWPDHGLKTSKVIGNRHAEIEALIEEPAVRSAVDALLEGRPFDRTIYRRPMVLFSLPNADTWTLPTGWHSDSPRLASGERPGVQLFVFLDHVVPGGGGTLVVAGSHRLLNDGRSIKPNEFSRLLSGEAFFRRLFSGRWAGAEGQAGLPTGAVGDVPLEVMELTGAPGDAWFIDLRLLHAAAPNAADHPRMMATHRFLRADVVREIADAYGWPTPGDPGVA